MQEQLAFRIYMTDSIRLLTENTAKMVGGAMIKQRYIDILNDKHDSTTAKKSGEELVLEFAKHAGLELI